MTGFDVVDSTRKLSEDIAFVLLKDANDHPRIQKRMEVMEGLFKERGLQVESVNINGDSQFHKIFSALILADWVAWYTSQYYGTLPEEVPMVEEFKNLL
jgi:glucose/mannose-6-phosphate isomerase